MNSLNVKKLLAVLSSAAMPTMVNAAETETVSTLIGDVNNDNKVTVADSVAILQYIANKDKYNLSGQLLLNGDVYNRGDGITARDALTIQRLDAKMIFSLPESEMETSSTTSTGTTVTTTASTTATAAGTVTTSTDVTHTFTSRATRRRSQATTQPSAAPS